MSTSEYDLRGDQPLLEVIGAFAGTRDTKQARRQPRWSPLRLKGLGGTTLRDHVEVNRTNDALIWTVEVSFDRAELDEGPFVLRYGMSSSELGDSWQDRDGRELRLRTLAEAHLRGDLELIRHGWPSRGPETVTMLDRRGWRCAD